MDIRSRSSALMAMLETGDNANVCEEFYAEDIVRRISGLAPQPGGIWALLRNALYWRKRKDLSEPSRHATASYSLCRGFLLLRVFGASSLPLGSWMVMHVALRQLRFNCLNPRRVDRSKQGRESAPPLRSEDRQPLRRFGAISPESGPGFQEVGVRAIRGPHGRRSHRPLCV